jgi:hypothetical protein
MYPRFTGGSFIINSNFQILQASNPENRQKWLEMWESWPGKEVFAHPGYLDLFAGKFNESCCAVFESEKGFVLYPFFYRNLKSEDYSGTLPENTADIISPYGYGGAFTWGYENLEELARNFWQYFDAWAVNNNIVTEVIKFSLFPEQVLPYPQPKSETLKNIVVNLELPEEELWQNFEHKVRKNVNKAGNHGIKVITETDSRHLEKFLAIYNSTMERRNASEKYYFHQDFFLKLIENLTGRFIFFYALYQEKIIAAELVLVSSDKIYSFLGGTESEFFNLRPNDLLKYEIILWAKRNLKKQFVLGGGYGTEDGIFKYKRSFAPAGIVPFYVGSRVLCPDLYKKLIVNKKEALAAKGIKWEPVEDFIPAYRS